MRNLPAPAPADSKWAIEVSHTDREGVFWEMGDAPSIPESTQPGDQPTITKQDAATGSSASTRDHRAGVRGWMINDQIHQKKDGWNVIIHIQSYYIHNQKLPFMVNMVGLYYYFMVDLVLWMTEILRKHLRGSYMELPHPGGGAMGCLPCIIMTCSPSLSQLPSHKFLIPTPKKIAKQNFTRIISDGLEFSFFSWGRFSDKPCPRDDSF